MIEQYLGFSSDYVILGLAALVLIMIILLIVFIVQMSKLKKRYRIFMQGNDAKSLEDTLVYRLDKLQKQTGLDLRIFEDAITFKIAMMVAKYMKYMESKEF